MNELRMFYANCSYEEKIIKKEDIIIVEQHSVCDGISTDVCVKLKGNSERWFSYFNLLYRNLWFNVVPLLDNNELEFYIKFLVDVESKVAYSPFLIIRNSNHDDCITADLTDEELKNLYDVFSEYNNGNNASPSLEKEEDYLFQLV